MWKNREQAGQALAQRLSFYRSAPQTIVLGVPKGGLIVASALSHVLGLPLEAFITEKLRFHCDPEVTLGAVTERGSSFVNLMVPGDVLSHAAPLEEEVARQLINIGSRCRAYRGAKALPSMKGKTILLVDDGIDTGATMMAASQALRAEMPRRVIAVAPVGPKVVVAALGAYSDGIAVLLAPENFTALRDYYRDFAPIKESDAIKVLSGSMVAS